VRLVGRKKGTEGEGERCRARGGGAPGRELLGLEGVEEGPVGRGGEDEAEAAVEVLFVELLSSVLAPRQQSLPVLPRRSGKGEKRREGRDATHAFREEPGSGEPLVLLLGGQGGQFRVVEVVVEGFTTDCRDGNGISFLFVLVPSSKKKKRRKGFSGDAVRGTRKEMEEAGQESMKER
jgi:hypothetical protein